MNERVRLILSNAEDLSKNGYLSDAICEVISAIKQIEFDDGNSNHICESHPPVTINDLQSQVNKAWDLTVKALRDAPLPIDAAPLYTDDFEIRRRKTPHEICSDH